MKAIVAVDRNWGIGKNNGLLFRLPADMKYFREKTMGKVVVMGSNTLLSFPGGNPLKNRTNIVLWPGGAPRADCLIVQSMEELKEALKPYDGEDVFVIGGGMFYRTMLPYCDEVYVTKVDADGKATVFYENLDARAEWTCAAVSEPVTDGEYTLRFTVYRNSAPEAFV